MERKAQEAPNHFIQKLHTKGGDPALFIGRKYVTKVVSQQIPIFLQNILWYLVETLPIQDKCYRQVFTLEPVTLDGKQKLRIIHIQRSPKYRQEYTITTKFITTTQIHVIDNHDHCIMMLASER